MNERIKKLLNQAGIYQLDRFDAIDGSNQMEKFAQLIVAECADIALTDGQATGNFEVFNKITKHFGVEE
jgi:hypothetical protein